MFKRVLAPWFAVLLAVKDMLQLQEFQELQ